MSRRSARVRGQQAPILDTPDTRRAAHLASNARARVVAAELVGSTPVPLPTDDPLSRNWQAPRTHNKDYPRNTRQNRAKTSFFSPPIPVCANSAKHPPAHLLKEKGARCFVAEQVYCAPCYHKFGVTGRRKMEDDRIEALRLHRDQPNADSSGDSAEESLADARRNYAVIIKYGCPHRNLNAHFRTAKRKNKCLCVQKYRHQGVALVDMSWNHRTRHMRLHWDLIMPPCDKFSWRPAAPLAAVAVAPDCLRAAVHNMHTHWGFKCKHEKALGHICTVATAMAIQNDGFIKAQTSPDRKTEKCYFIDFRDYISILKGLSSLWKHIKGLGPQTRL